MDSAESLLLGEKEMKEAVEQRGALSLVLLSREGLLWSRSAHAKGSLCIFLSRGGECLLHASEPQKVKLFFLKRALVLREQLQG